MIFKKILLLFVVFKPVPTSFLKELTRAKTTCSLTKIDGMHWHANKTLFDKILQGLNRCPRKVRIAPKTYDTYTEKCLHHSYQLLQLYQRSQRERYS